MLVFSCTGELADIPHVEGMAAIAGPPLGLEQNWEESGCINEGTPEARSFSCFGHRSHGSTRIDDGWRLEGVPERDPCSLETAAYYTLAVGRATNCQAAAPRDSNESQIPMPDSCRGNRAVARGARVLFSWRRGNLHFASRSRRSNRCPARPSHSRRPHRVRVRLGPHSGRRQHPPHRATPTHRGARCRQRSGNRRLLRAWRPSDEGGIRTSQSGFFDGPTPPRRHECLA
jgi:hypothetical protein